MPRGFKKDIETTRVVRAIGLLQDDRSFISLTGHGILKGADVCAARQRAIGRAKGNPGGAINCQALGCDSAYYSDEMVEMHHLNNKPAERCDCDHNLAIWCPPCHRKRHNQ